MVFRRRFWSGERGQNSITYSGVIAVVALLVAALLGSAPLWGEKLVCSIDAAINGGAGCGAPVTPVNIDASTELSIPQNAAPEDGNETPTHTFDQAKVDDAVKTIQDNLDGGFFGNLRRNELKAIEEAFSELNGAEKDAVIAALSDSELGKWVRELEQPNWIPFLGGKDVIDRQSMWTSLLRGTSPETINRMAEHTTDIQPEFNDVNGDWARPKNQNEAPEGHYEDPPEGSQAVIDGVTPEDAKQLQLGDCWYIASLQAVARDNPDIIESAITDNENGSFTVRLYDKNGDPVYVTVTDDEVRGADNMRLLAHSNSNEKELWPAIMEKALAAYRGSYGNTEGGFGGEGMQIITGKPSTKRNDFSAKDLQQALEKRQAVTAGSKPFGFGDPLYGDHPVTSNGKKLPDKIHSRHAYSVQGVDLGDPSDPSDDTVTVYNPWNNGNSVLVLPFEDFKRAFPDISFNPVK